ncbi:MAG: DUF3313 family protein [Xanthomonadales bacterium]|nr:DUF3313 family protein [Xanthomonadales bacterium]
MKLFGIILTVFILSCFSINVMAKKQAEIPEYTVEGLKLVPNTKEIALVWAEPGADLAQYKRVYLVEPYVAFKKNWQRDQNRGSMRVKGSDMERIKTKVRNLFMEVFTEELENGGYELATERAEDVLIVKPAIIDLDVNAPDIRTAGRTETYARSAGAMTLYMELYDSETDDLIAKAMDGKAERDYGYMQWQTGPANRAAARRMMQPWAKALREGLDEARSSNSQAD